MEQRQGSAVLTREGTRRVLALSLGLVLAAGAGLGQAMAVPEQTGAAAPETELVAVADALVRDGQYADENYASTSPLQWKVGSAGFSRESFVTFDLTPLEGEIETATLRMFGRVSGGEPQEWPDETPNLIHEVLEDWSEDTLTWNTRPAVAPEPLTSFVIGGESDQSNRWHEVDLTEALAATLAQGHEVFSLRMSRDVATGPLVQMHSREASNPPVLVINETETEPEPPIEGPLRSELYPEDWHPGMIDDEGRFLHDFSYAGYRYGAEVPQSVPGPTFDVTHPRFGADPTGVEDSTQAIQAAIDAAGAAGGGTVHLPPGTFRVAPQGESRAVLHIGYDDVLLRGAGPDQTRIYNSTAEGMRQSTVVFIGPDRDQWQSWHDSEAEQERPAVALTQDITEPTRTLHVADAGGFAVGDWVILKADVTEEWLAEHPVEDGQNWTPDTFRALVYHRQITAVDEQAGTVQIDIPTRYTMLMRDGLRLHHHHAPLTGGGIADLSMGARQSDLPGDDGENDYLDPDTAAYQVHGSSLVTFNNTVDGWVNNVHTFRPQENTRDVHTLSGGVHVWYARSITVTDADMRNPQYNGAGGNGYHYHLMGSDSLVRDSYAEGGRHNYLVQAVQGTGNVFLDSHSVDGERASEAHRHLGAANLFDNVSVDGDTFEMRYRPWSTHAHSTTESVLWNISGENCTRGRLAMSQQFGWGYVIGTTGTGDCAIIDTPGGQYTEPIDHVEHQGLGELLEPRSLYLDQRERRLDAQDPAPEPPVDELRTALDQHMATGAVAGPIADQLTNALDEVERHIDGGRTTPAVVALERFLEHLESPARPDVLTEDAAAELRDLAQSLRLHLQ
ncbi:DUF7594 domain-containing protein [Pseudactinotalea sp. Z1748]|uniref:CBM96 family carbohydrate-binding protein n=1 Tax=Pseudactinotalea sp. Z1748 TaxID=3413027 RepID=UPI003C7DC984